ncbi:MAG: AAA family ATPase [Thermoplasmata archaeon]|nr:AAA family ATPase [Thermoplasmata archaeon]MCI4359928.1 AAA family ATPase [Thermoplasmata archaeon]
MPASRGQNRLRSPARYVALSGTPGTGKSRCAGSLPPLVPVVEVATLALRTRLGRSVATGVEVDLGRLGRWLSRQPPPARTTLIVGHLSHLLPVREVILLRCHPIELYRRLQRARRGNGRARRENASSEALDGVLLECLELGRSVREVDTTGRSVRSVAREVGGLARTRWQARYGSVDWLADPRVTDFLLRDPS